MKRLAILAAALALAACGRAPDRLVDGSGRVVSGRLTALDGASATFKGFSVEIPGGRASVLLRSGALYRGDVSLESGTLSVSGDGIEASARLRDVAVITWGPASVRNLLLDVHAGSGWCDTHLYVERGARVVILAGGSSVVGTGTVGPEGLERTATTISLSPESLDGSLVGRIGEDGDPFTIGESWASVAETDGYLELAVNAPSTGAAAGYYTVSITVESDGTENLPAIFPGR